VDTIIFKAMEVGGRKGQAGRMTLPKTIRSWISIGTTVVEPPVCVRVPRHFVPRTEKGRLALRLGFEYYHRGWDEMIPPRLRVPLEKFGASWLGQHFH
jgi:hypothetical protein